LGTCSPAGDILPVLAALDASIHVISASGMRDVTWNDFMLGVKRNALDAGEIVHSVSLPVIDGWQGYAKVGTRNAMVISTASACLVRDVEEGLVTIALGAVGPTVIRCFEAERWLATSTGLRRGVLLSDEISHEFGRRVAREARPIDDHRSTAEYRRHAVGVLATRLLKRSFA
jgi:CO/xanthine dehydrogenase FAD-binding subunit